MPPAGERPPIVRVLGLMVAVGAALVLLVDAGPVRAEAEGATGRLAVELGLGQRDDQVAAAGGQVSAEGSALSGVALAGAWVGRRTDARLGAAGRLAVERFTLPGAARSEVVVTGMEVRSGPALRTGERWLPFRIEGEVGYGFWRLPLAAARSGVGPGIDLGSDPLNAHGPAARATVGLAVRPWLGGELAAGLVPITFGGDR